MSDCAVHLALMPFCLSLSLSLSLSLRQNGTPEGPPLQLHAMEEEGYSRDLGKCPPPLAATFNPYLGNSPSTLQTYSLRTCLVLICCSISLKGKRDTDTCINFCSYKQGVREKSTDLAFFGFLPKSSRPEVSLSNLWMVRRFLRPCSLARMKTTVLWR